MRVHEPLVGAYGEVRLPIGNRHYQQVTAPKLRDGHFTEVRLERREDFSAMVAAQLVIAANLCRLDRASAGAEGGSRGASGRAAGEEGPVEAVRGRECAGPGALE